MSMVNFFKTYSGTKYELSQFLFIFRDLIENDIKFTHGGVFHNMSSLTNLDLDNNNIDILPDFVFAGCTSLVSMCV